MTDEELLEKIQYLRNIQAFKELKAMTDILEELFLRQQKIMKILQVHVTPQVMELILNGN